MSTLATQAGIIVRPYSAECWRDLWTLRLCQLAEAGIVLGPEAIPERPEVVQRGDLEWDYHQIDQVYLSGRGGFWLAWCGGAPAGHVGAQDLGDGVELRHMYVRQELRRRGIGSRLVGDLIAHCAAQGVGAIGLWTAERGPGRALYEHMGFRVVSGPGPEFANAASLTAYEPGADEVRMRLTPLALPA